MYAFAYSKIKSISIPNSVTKIGWYAFLGCEKLENVKLSENIKILGDSVFQDCKRIKKLSLPKSIKNIGSYAFYGCENLSKIIINSTDKAPKVEDNAFLISFMNDINIKFYVKNQKVAKSLKKKLKGSGVKNANIYVGDTLVYSNINYSKTN